MALKVELKPHERIIIGACVITNTDQRTKLLIEGEKIPILREKDILTPATADTPAKLIYLAVQLMYLSPDPQAHHPAYFSLMRDMLHAAPSSWPFIEGINNHILNGDVYLALKEAKKLIAHEDGLLAERQEPASRKIRVTPTYHPRHHTHAEQKGLQKEAFCVWGAYHHRHSGMRRLAQARNPYSPVPTFEC